MAGVDDRAGIGERRRFRCVFRFFRTQSAVTGMRLMSPPISFHASAMSRHWEFAGANDIARLAQEFAHTLRSELNYLQEARNAEAFAHNFAGDPKVHIPRVFWEMTTSRVLTLERKPHSYPSYGSDLSRGVKPSLSPF